MYNSEEVLKSIKGGLIVSCQALEDEPLHSSYIMMRMAKAALDGGAIGIRANSPEDCKEIKNSVNLPMISIYKKVYGTSNVYITPTINQVKELISIKPEIIAVDATRRKRPDGKSLEEFFKEIREVYDGLLLADISDLEEGIRAEKIGFDMVSTTLSGYTDYTLDREKPDINLIKSLREYIKIPIIAEGNIDSPENAMKCLEAGAWAVVVGGAITRPQLITKKFVEYINKSTS